MKKAEQTFFGWRVVGPVDLRERPVTLDPALRPFEVRSWRLEKA